MRSLKCLGDGRIALREVPDPVPGPDDALVRIEASAVCGSERRGLYEGMDGNSGHEACGTVIVPGSSAFKVGDRVGLSALVGCEACDQCRAGREMHCRRGVRPSSKSGGWHADLAVVRSAALRELPSGVEPEIGALLSGDALGVPARALERAPSAPGDGVLVVGLGPVGLGHVLVRAFMGSEVIAIEPAEFRRRFGAQLGAKGVLEPDSELPFVPELIIECSGRPESIAYALGAVDRGGTVLQSGECDTEVPIVPSDVLIRREVTYTGSYYYASEDYPRMLDLHSRGLPLASLCTHDVVADEAEGAISEFLAGNTGKVIIRWT